MERRFFIGAGAATLLAPHVLHAAPAALANALRQAPNRAPRRLDRPIRLASNENPLGLPDRARDAIIAQLVDGNRYPGTRGDAVIDALAARLGVERACLLLGNGSTQILQNIVQAWAQAGARIILPDPTFEHVERYAAPFDGDVHRVPLRDDGAHDLGRMQALAHAAPGASLVFICNPNNPTGTLTSCDDIESWIRSAPEHVTFLVDEAYYDFVAEPGYRTMLPYIAQPNVIISRTFSKIYGLAGLRIGHAIAHPATIARVRMFAQISNINVFAIAAAIASLDEHEYVAESLRTNAAGLRSAAQTLDELEIPYMHSHTNFIMHRVRDGAATYAARMRDAGILVGRPFPPMLDWNRVSIGTPDEMHVWADTLHTFRQRNWI